MGARAGPEPPALRAGGRGTVEVEPGRRMRAAREECEVYGFVVVFFSFFP